MAENDTSSDAVGRALRDIHYTEIGQKLWLMASTARATQALLESHPSHGRTDAADGTMLLDASMIVGSIGRQADEVANMVEAALLAIENANKERATA